MSRFSEALRTLMILQDLNQTELGSRSGVSSAYISRLLDGGRTAAPETVGRLAAALSGDRSHRVDLILAYARDLAVEAGLPAGIDERHVVIAPMSEDAAEAIKGAGSLGADLELLAEECAAHEDVRAMVVDLAAMIRRHRAELADAQQPPPLAKEYPFPGDKSVPAVAEPPPPARRSRAAPALPPQPSGESAG